MANPVTPSSEILRSNKEQILDDWLTSLSSILPSVVNHDKSAIEDSVPDLINAIIENLESNNKDDIIFHSQQHGHYRTDFKEYSLRHVIKEYNLLKRELFRHIDQNITISKDERNVIMDAVDQAIEQAAETFYKIKQGVQVNARKLAEKKADELKLEDDNREEFIHSISHDLNNPLNNIKTCVVLLENDLDIEKVGEILRILKNSIDKAEFLIKDFLDVGQVHADEGLPLHRIHVDVLDDLKKEIEVYRVTQKANVDLNSNEQELFAKIDIELFRRAFYNLMNNAIKFGEKDGIITVSCIRKKESFSVSVHNGGEVIQEQVRKNIFNRYYQTDTSGRGWGLGLAFVKKVVESHGGEVSVKSEDKGTLFEMTLPLN